MSATATLATEVDRDALVERLFDAHVGALELLTIHLGLELGLYAAVRDRGPLDAAGLAATTPIDTRYAREWLEQQATAGLVEVAAGPAGDGGDDRRYRLAGHVAEVLLDPDSPVYLAPMATATAGLGTVSGEVLAAYREGRGLGFGAYGREIRHGIGHMNRAMYVNDLVTSWIPAAPRLQRRIQRAGARVLDLGCGIGASTLALARGFPAARVHGVDLDPASVEEARAAAVELGLAQRVTFGIGDAAAFDAEEAFDVVTILEALHDMGDPVGALRAARRSLRPGGLVLVADERAAARFGAIGDPLERYLYGWSVLHCLPATRAEDHVVATGTVLRPATVRAWADLAGFATVDEVAVDHDFWRFYLLSA